MRELKFITIFVGFFVFCVGFCLIPSLRSKILIAKNSIREMFHINSEKILSYRDIPIKRIRYINNNNFEVVSCNGNLINFTLSYKIFKENKSAILLYLNNINNPIIKIKKQLDDDYISGEISGIYDGNSLSLREYLSKHGVFNAR